MSVVRIHPAPPLLWGGSSAVERVNIRLELFLRFVASQRKQGVCVGIIKSMLLVKDFGYFLKRAQFEPVRSRKATGA